MDTDANADTYPKPYRITYRDAHGKPISFDDALAIALGHGKRLRYTIDEPDAHFDAHGYSFHNTLDHAHTVT